MKPLQTAIQEYEQKVAEALCTKEYPENLSHIKGILHDCLRHCSLHKIGCNPFTYENFVTFARPFFMNEVLFITKIICAASPKELNQTIEENLNMLKTVVFPIEDKWLSIKKEISEPISREIETRLAITRQVPIGKKIFKANE